jgi:flotillin
MAHAKAKMAIESTDFNNNMQIAEITAKAKAEIRDAELQRELEVKRAFVIAEKFRAENLSKAIVDAEAMKTIADANYYKAKTDSDAEYYMKEKEAQSLQSVYEAQAEGIQQLHDSMNGDNRAIIQYLFMERGVYKDMAYVNANAVTGLQPEITVWGTGFGQELDTSAIMEWSSSIQSKIATK